jgi:uncharacterized damage-inducible protein DinB
MSYQKIIHALVGYHVASNRRLWQHLAEHLTDEQFTQPLSFSHGSIRNQVVHQAVTDRYWLHDIQSKPVTGLDPEDYPTRESFAAAWEGIQAALLEYVTSLDAAALEETPDGLMETRGEAIVHVVNHGTDHRAQILSMLHGLGAPTFEQDFPDYLRSRRRVSRASVLKLVQYWHAKWEQALGSIPPEKMAEQDGGGRAVKDIIAHLAWYERQVAATLMTRQLTNPELWALPRDERNRQLYEQHRSHLLEDVLQEHRRAHDALIHELERLDDDDLNDPSQIQGLPPGTRLWEWLERHIWFHYLEHTEDLWVRLGSG